MNRPIRPLSKADKSTSHRSDRYFTRRRRGLCTAEEIVTLILKRYGLDEVVFDEEPLAEPALNDATESPVPVPLTASQPASQPAQQQLFCID